MQPGASSRNIVYDMFNDIVGAWRSGGSGWLDYPAELGLLAVPTYVTRLGTRPGVGKGMSCLMDHGITICAASHRSLQILLCQYANVSIAQGRATISMN